MMVVDLGLFHRFKNHLQAETLSSFAVYLFKVKFATGFSASHFSLTVRREIV